MNILITGGCGYLGYSLVRKLLLLKGVSSITLYDNLSRSSSSAFLGEKMKHHDKVKLVVADILDTYTLERELDGINTVIHLAAMASTPFADRNVHGFDQVNNWGTGVLTSAIESSSSVSKLIYVSSLSVYGDTQGQVIDESSTTAPKTFYGISKLNGERHVERLSKKMDTIIVRLGNVFGYNPSIRLDAVVNRLMFDAHFKGKVEIHGSGEQKRAFIDVKSVANYLSKACLYKHENGMFNLVNYNLSILEIIDHLKKLYSDLQLFHLDQHLRMRSISASSKYLSNSDNDLQTFKKHLIELQENFSF